MQLRHLKTIVQPQEGMAKVTALAWSPNNQKLAVVTVDRVVSLYDETGEKRDKFSTKPADKGPKNYIVRAMYFSPDSTKLAIAQSDNIVFVYKLGLEWGDKKSICNKFHQTAPITCLTWPSSRVNEVVFGLADGKVKIGLLRTNKPAKLSDGDGTYVTAIASSPDGNGIVWAHLNGSIFRYYFDDNGAPSHARIAHHPCVPYALGWGTSIVVAGNDSQVIFYDADGENERTFDYQGEEKVKEFTVAAFNPSGDTVVIGNFNRFYTFTFDQKTETWEEVGMKEVENMYTVTALSWKPDGSRLAVGALCGVLDWYDACVRRYRYKGKFEFTYVSLSQVIVKRLSNGTRIVLKSLYGCEVTKINIFQDRYVVAHTPQTLLLGDLETFKLSEVQWSGEAAGGGKGGPGKEDTEKFIFDNPSVAIVYYAGEVSIVEYGQNEMLGSVRTQYISSHLLSVRINERPPGVADPAEAAAAAAGSPSEIGEDGAGGAGGGGPQNKKIAYLLDAQTIHVKDLVTQAASTVNHDSKVDWLELNGRGNLLLFRDKRRQLHLFSIATQVRSTLLSYCTYAQWVPYSDVVVAQNRGNLNVWYNINAPDQVTVHQIKGDVEEIERADGRTEVVVDEGISTASYLLDEPLIEFGTALEDRDYFRAMDILDALEVTPEAEAMWRQLGAVSLEDGDLAIAERCAAALGDMSRARFLRKVNKIATEAAERVGGDGRDHWAVRARLAQLGCDLRGAEDILLSQGRGEDCIEMYQMLHQFEEAIRVAESSNHEEAETMRRQTYQYLLDTSQEERGAKMKEEEGDYHTAINLYLKGGLPAQAANLIERQGITQPSSLLETVAASLSEHSMDDRAGDFYEQLGQLQRALDCYISGRAYRKAVDLARKQFPSRVVPLHEEWGDWLVSQQQVDMAINHYIEANEHMKAIEAALTSRQWSKAGQLLDSVDAEAARPYYRRLARHYDEAKQLPQAERCYVAAGQPQLAVEMYSRVGQWERAHKLATSHMSENEVAMLYISQAQHLEEAGKYKEAEKRYLAVSEPDLAIAMYKKRKKYDAMLRLVASHRQELLKETQLFLAQQNEMEGNLKEAEKHYVDANEYPSAVNMYRSNEMWEDAMRVAKINGGAQASKRVAFAWSMQLGVEAAIKAMNKLGLLEAIVDMAVESANYDFAFGLAKGGMGQAKVQEVHLKYALFLEDEEKYDEAEAEFIKASKPREAIDMYVHQHDWATAIKIAEEHDPAAVADVHVAQARVEAEKGDYAKAEELFIQASKPDLALEMYTENSAWKDALRVAQRHLPHKVAEIQLAHQAAQAQTGEGGSKIDYLNAGRMWENSGQWSQAVEAYMNATKEVLTDPNDLEEVLLKAVEVARARLQNRYVEISREVSKRLCDVGRVEAAADVLRDCDQLDEALEVAMKGRAYEKAKELAQQHPDRDWVRKVEEEYQGHLVKHENTDELVELGHTGAALDVLAQRGDWDRLWDTAKKEGVSALHVAKYAAKRAKMLLGEAATGEKGETPLGGATEADEAVSTLRLHGAPINAQFVDLYRDLASTVLGRNQRSERAMGTVTAPGAGGADTEIYQSYCAAVGELRDLLYQVSDDFKSSTGAVPYEVEELLMAAHYMRIYHIAQREGLKDLSAKVAITLLRYTGVVPADKAFYMAGMSCRAAGNNSLAFVLLNRYVDLTEAVEEGDASGLDNADLADATAVPFDFPLPGAQYVVDEGHREEIREWVLSICMDADIEQGLPPEEEAAGTLYEGLFEGRNLPTCIVTGFPVRERDRLDINYSVANKRDWNAYVRKVKKDPWTGEKRAPIY